jgi:hypothetical protein
MPASKYPITLDEALAEVTTKPVVALWPTVALLLGLSRDGVYDAANRGEIEFLEYGGRKKAISAALRKKLGLETA